MSEKIWVEKYRPTEFDDLIVSPEVKNKLISITNEKNPPHVILYGDPGNGKTTAAKIIASKICSSPLFINASIETSIEVLRGKIFDYASTVSLLDEDDAHRQKVVILDECEQISNGFVAALRAFLEQFSSHVTFILTTNYINKIADPLRSRAVEIEFNFNKKELAKLTFSRVVEILDNENVKYDKKEVLKYVLESKQDFRKMINNLQIMCASGDFDISASTSNDYDTVLDYLKNKNWKLLREYVANNYDRFDFFEFYKFIEQSKIQRELLPEVISTLNESQYRAQFVASLELNVLNCLTGLMKLYKEN